MPSRRRSRSKNLGTSLSDVQRRMRYLERRPVRTKLQRKVVTTAAIAPNAVTPDEVDFGTTIITTDPVEDIQNPKDGLLVVNPNDESAQIYNGDTGEYIPLPSVDTVARTTADGKNTIYRQDSEPTGDTYANGDLWFDTDNDNAFSRYSAASTSTVTNKALSGNVATLTTSAPHTFVVGETITVSGVDSIFNGSYTVTATPTATTVRYAKTASNVTSTTATGSISNTAGWKAFSLGDGAIASLSANKLTAGSIDARVITVSYIDAAEITVGKLAADMIGAGTIDATISINGPTITGGTIQTSTTGSRVALTNNDNIEFYNASNTLTASISPVDYFGSDNTGVYLYTPDNLSHITLTDGLIDIGMLYEISTGVFSNVILSMDNSATDPKNSSISIGTSGKIKMASVGIQISALGGNDMSINENTISLKGQLNIDATSVVSTAPSGTTGGNNGDLRFVRV